MSPKARLVWGLLAGLLATATFAQDAGDYDEDNRPKRATKIPTEGFWPTQKMMDRVIDRITDQMGVHYQFDDNQLELTRELFKARFPEFLNENRAEIQTLLNHYFEALLDDEPPAVEAVAEWAGRVQPLLAEFSEVCHEVTEGMREYLTDEQQTTLDAETATFEAGITMAQNKLSVWATGGYDPETEWIHQGRNRREREAAEEQAPRDGSGQGPTADAAAEAGGSQRPKTGGEVAPTPAKDAWTIYTERFIKRYQLNDEQKQKALTFLRRQQEQRDKYLRRQADEMAQVTKVLKQAETEEERQAALEAYQRLNAPVERMFEQLKEKLDTLPTRAQRKAAAQAGLKPAGERKPADARQKAAESRPCAPSPQTAPASEAEHELEGLEEPGDSEPPATQPSEPEP